MPYACTYRRACCSTSPLNACRSAKQHRDNGDAKGLLEAVRELSSLELQLAFLRREGGPHGVQPLVQLLLDNGKRTQACNELLIAGQWAEAERQCVSSRASSCSLPSCGAREGHTACNL